MKLTPTNYGFQWGPVLVERHVSSPRGLVIGIDAGKRHLDVIVSPSGRSIRVVDWDTGEAWKPRALARERRRGG